MVEPFAFDGERDRSEEQLLLPEAGNGDQSWRLNFDGFQLSEEHKEKPPRGLHDCLGVLGPRLCGGVLSAAGRNAGGL